jgi:preprotein translocase subunit SecA
VPIHEVKSWEDFKLSIYTGNFVNASDLAEAMAGQDKQKAKDIARMGSEWIKDHEKVVQAGGLHILGTERHEARRIDNQLRGRSGRQGDPGSYRFYLSLEDDLMRIFGSERIASVMQRLGMEEGQEIESKMVTKAIANAQKRVEGRNFEIRKHLLEYDDVMNSQRESIYKLRNEILDGEDISQKIRDYINDICEYAVDSYSGGERNSENWDIDGLKGFLKTKFMLNIDSDIFDAYSLSRDDFMDAVSSELFKKYEAKEKELPPGDMRVLERLISLQAIDSKWREHLLNMDELRDGIWTAGYENINPLVEYKLQGMEIFRDMLDALKEDILEYLLKVQVKEIVQQEAEYRYIPAGDEFHAEVEQFGSGGIPLSAAPQQPVQRRNREKENPDKYDTHAGVKRKKTRRSRRR